MKKDVKKRQKQHSAADILEQARRVIRIEAGGVNGLLERLDDSFSKAVELLYNCKGRAIVSGIGKSGIVGRKIAATLTSTGTPAVFIHPVDFLHGDMGLITDDDVFIAVSKSGETGEVERMIHYFKRLGIKIVAVTGSRNSSLASLSDIVLDVGVSQEACPHDLAPTASTTATMVMGDALAIALLVRRNFRPEDFARLHPGGSLGKGLLLRVEELMVSGKSVGMVSDRATMKEVLLELVAKRGICTVVDSNNCMMGVVTDGDFKRLLQKNTDFMEIKAVNVMNNNPKSVGAGELCITAVKMMEKYSIISMPVLEEDNRVVGIVHLHDLMRARVI